jgi:hypothetical protein
METDVFDFIDCSYSKLIDESITKSFHISILKILGLRIFEKYTTTPPPLVYFYPTSIRPVTYLSTKATNAIEFIVGIALIPIAYRLSSLFADGKTG